MARRPPQARPESAVLDRIAMVQADPSTGDSLEAEYAALADQYRGLVDRFYKTIAISDAYQAQIKDLSAELERATVNFRRLREVALPICVHCRKVHAGDAYWQRLETYLIQNLDMLFSQGLCPDCLAARRESLGTPSAAGPRIPQLPPLRKAPRQAEDKVAGELRELAERAAHEGSPLAGDIAKAARDCAKLSRRFGKTVTISDAFQAQLRELNTQLELMARTDLLTGFANRWEMIARIEAERARALRYRLPLSVILGDIDLFKTVNDTYGHLVGDKVLRTMAETLRSSLRQEDICARWGGEEFLFLLPETDSGQARTVAEKLRKAVRQCRLDMEGHSIAVTMSFGVGELLPEMSVDTCLRLVDDALYAAKADGRDQVVMAGEGNDATRVSRVPTGE